MAKKAMETPRPTVGRGKKKTSKSEIQKLAQDLGSQTIEAELSESELISIPISGPNSTGTMTQSHTSMVSAPRHPSPPPESSHRWANTVMAEKKTERVRNEGIKVKQNPNFSLEFDPIVANATEVSSRMKNWMKERCIGNTRWSDAWLEQKFLGHKWTDSLKLDGQELLHQQLSNKQESSSLPSTPMRILLRYMKLSPISYLISLYC